MVKVLANEFKKKIKKNPFLPIILVVVFLILIIAGKVSYDVFVEKESIKSDFFGNEQKEKFNIIVDSQILSTDPLVINRVDSDIRPLLEKHFGTTKFDRNFLLKSDLKSNWHMFYFTQKAAKLEDYQQNFIPELSDLGYNLTITENSRTYEFEFDFQNSKYLLIISLLAYDSDDTMGIYMIYLEKLE